MKRDITPVKLIRDHGGWMSLEKAVQKMDGGREEVKKQARLWEREGKLTTLDLGETILLVDPMVQKEDAVAAYFDQKEREFRTERDWPLPHWEGFDR